MHSNTLASIFFSVQSLRKENFKCGVLIIRNKFVAVDDVSFYCIFIVIIIFHDMAL